MDSNESEACGRCAMTSVVDTTQSETEDDDGPFGEARIELTDADLRIASAPAVVAGRVKHRLNELAMRFVYGR